MRREYLSPREWKNYIIKEEVPLQCVLILGKKIKEHNGSNVALLMEESITGTNYVVHGEKKGVANVSFYNKKDYLKIVEELKQEEAV